MTKDEAIELIERMPYITTLMISNDKTRLELFKAALKSENPVELVKLIKTDYIRQNDKNSKKQPSDEERKIALTAKKLLYSELSSALCININEVESFINKHISEEW